MAKDAARFASALGCEAAGELMGLLHDYGKYCEEFLVYLQSASGVLLPDDAEWVALVRLPAG